MSDTDHSAMDLEPTTIELRDTTPAAATVEKSSALPKLAVLAVLVLTVWLVLRGGGTEAASPRMALPKVAEPTLDDLWPDPPDDFDPQFSIVPHRGGPLLGEVTEQTIVYVNSIGRPTVVNLDSGFRYEVTIAAPRSHDHFSVELGEIVSVDQRNQNVPLAGDRSLRFDVITTPTQQAPPLGSPVLCTTIEGCPMPRWPAQVLSNGPDRVERITVETHPAIHELVHAPHDEDGRFLLIDVGGDEPFRLPKPLYDRTDVWVIHQPAGASWPDLGRAIGADVVATTDEGIDGRTPALLHIDLDTGTTETVGLPSTDRPLQLVRIADDAILLDPDGGAFRIRLDPFRLDEDPRFPAGEPTDLVRGGVLVGSEGAATRTFVSQVTGAVIDVEVPAGEIIAGVSESGLVYAMQRDGTIDAWRDGEIIGSELGVLAAVHGDDALTVFCRSSGCAYRLGEIGGAGEEIAASGASSVQGIETLTIADPGGAMGLVERNGDDVAVLVVDLAAGELVRIDGFGADTFDGRPWMLLPDHAGVVSRSAIVDFECRCRVDLPTTDRPSIDWFAVIAAP